MGACTSSCVEEVLPASVRHNMYVQLLWLWGKAGAIANDWLTTERDCPAGRSHLLGALPNQVLPFPLYRLYYYFIKAGKVLYSFLCTLGLSCAEKLKDRILLLKEAGYILIFEIPCLLEGVFFSCYLVWFILLTKRKQWRKKDRSGYKLRVSLLAVLQGPPFFFSPFFLKWSSGFSLQLLLL